MGRKIITEKCCCPRFDYLTCFWLHFILCALNIDYSNTEVLIIMNICVHDAWNLDLGLTSTDGLKHPRHMFSFGLKVSAEAEMTSFSKETWGELLKAWPASVSSHGHHVRCRSLNCNNLPMALLFKFCFHEIVWICVTYSWCVLEFNWGGTQTLLEGARNPDVQEHSYCKQINKNVRKNKQEQPSPGDLFINNSQDKLLCFEASNKIFKRFSQSLALPITTETH